MNLQSLSRTNKQSYNPDSHRATYMILTTPLRHLFRLTALAASLALISPVTQADESSNQAFPKNELTADFVYKYLVGEVAGQRGELGIASSLFLDLAKSSRDARLAERSAKAAIFGNNPVVAVQAV